jgi:hypothetical protein
MTPLDRRLTATDPQPESRSANTRNLAFTDPRCNIFGQTSFGNGAYVLIQLLANGDLSFNPVGRPLGVPLVEG